MAVNDAIKRELEDPDTLWRVTERRYHERPDGRFLVHLEGALRGPVETDDEAAAKRIAAVLNTCDCGVLFTGMILGCGMDRHPLEELDCG